MIRPYEALLQPLQPPPPTSILNSPALSNETHKPAFVVNRLQSTAKIFQAVRHFTAALLNSRRERMMPPDYPSHPANLDEYVKHFVMDRIANLFSQLQSNYVSQVITGSNSPHSNWKILESSSAIICGLHCFTFHAPRAHLSARALRSPAIVLCPPYFYRQVVEPETRTELISSFLYTLETGYKTFILFTDMQQLTIFQRMDDPSAPRTKPKATHRTINIRGDPYRLCIIIASLLHDGLPRSKFPINLSFTVDDSGEYESLAGPARDDSSDVRSDKVVFATCHRHSDFDFVSIICGGDLRRARQFMQWKAYIARHVESTFARVGDVIAGITDGFFENNVPLRPYYSPDPLPETTMDHIRHHQRLRDAISKFLLESSSFSVKLLDDLTGHARAVMCRTYRCTISVELPGTLPAKSSQFCVKFFDDRFLSFQAPNSNRDLMRLDPEEQLDAIRRYWDTAEECIKREDAAYKKLGEMQGSLIPYYYGAYKFILPSGHSIYGILMEYIPARSLMGGIGRALSIPQQIQLVESVRHAVRVLQYSDVSQHDWHPGQVLCHFKNDNSVHGVLIDFSQTRQSYCEGETRMEDDAGNALRILCNKRTGLDPELVWSHWAPREHWDHSSMIVNGHDYSWPHPFRFVLSSIPP